jgi:hypothetical protein
MIEIIFIITIAVLPAVSRFAQKDAEGSKEHPIGGNKNVDSL